MTKKNGMTTIRRKRKLLVNGEPMIKLKKSRYRIPAATIYNLSNQLFRKFINKNYSNDYRLIGAVKNCIR